ASASSGLNRAAVDVPGLSGHPSPLVAGEEDGYGGDLLWLDQALLRRVGGEGVDRLFVRAARALLDIPGAAPSEGGRHVPRADRVDRHAGRHDLLRDGSGEAE